MPIRAHLCVMEDALFLLVFLKRQYDGICAANIFTFAPCVSFCEVTRDQCASSALQFVLQLLCKNELASVRTLLTNE